MESNSQKSIGVQEISTFLAGLLPILQLAFVYLPENIKSIYLSPHYFVGVSILTTLISYIIIIAYKTRPWFSWYLPFQSQRISNYDDWLRRNSEASAAKNFVLGEQASAVKINTYLKNLNSKPIKKPYEINDRNILSLSLIFLLINALSFLILGQQKYGQPAAIMQSINYLFLIVISVFILIMYRTINQNNKKHEEEQNLRVEKSIELAVKNNCFTMQPQVRFISCHQDGFAGPFFVRVEFDNNEYEIKTDQRAQQLIYCYKILR